MSKEIGLRDGLSGSSKSDLVATKIRMKLFEHISHSKHITHQTGSNKLISKA